MKASSALAVALIALASPPLLAQQPEAAGLGEVVVTATRMNIRYFQENRPVVGLRRAADSAAMPLAISSDARDEATRKREIHTALLAAIDRAAANGLELVSGTVQLNPITRTNYQELPFQWAGRVDTSKVDLMVKVRLAGSAAAAEKRLVDFIKAVPRSGRAAVDKTGAMTLTIVDPDQYRDAIVQLVAQDAKHNAAIFGPEFTFNISGIDGAVSWSQVSSTDVFLSVPYRYTIVPK